MSRRPMSINDKIKQILIDKNLTPSYFADEIGVQRSSISHILSGRNRPSFDIIQKIIRRFPELGYEWIMEEDNQLIPPSTAPNFSNRAVPNSVNRPVPDRFNPGITYSTTQPIGIRSQRNEIPPSLPQNQPIVEHTEPLETVAPSTEKRVERILIFYTDGSFKEYTPTA